MLGMQGLKDHLKNIKVYRNAYFDKNGVLEFYNCLQRYKNNQSLGKSTFVWNITY